ncbi:Ribosome maturation factor RimP [Candidatus Xenohaliotis californiensis]|uniref:Ribosome maturation factor RimP n=1 Tax=Candidatus Xenohaliotis californiensis TaxID=84677 RepID=A0ABM9N914_9RICK|nr:Ribosome maturation factor RimP [Candidatus Xenohaliotis californiensis]
MFVDVVQSCLKQISCCIDSLVFNKNDSILDVTIDRLDGLPVNISDCSKAAKNIRFALSTSDPLPNVDYAINVGSPGLDRPLANLNDFLKFKGRVVVLLLTPGSILGVNDKIKGIISDVVDNKIVIKSINKDKNNELEIVVPYSCIWKAKLSF